MIKKIVLGGGCFWCIEAIMQQLKGVVLVEPGYAGGTVDDPNYPMVCTGKTGHAEVVRVTFDDAVISEDILVRLFLAMHDPTTKDRQGADVGTQYRSIVLCDSEEQKQLVEKIITAMQPLFDDPIVTQVEMLSTFYPAEEVHREFYKNHPEQMYCQMVITPKLIKLRQSFSHLLQEKSQIR